MKNLYKKIKEIYPEDVVLTNEGEISIVEDWLVVSYLDGFYYLNSICCDCDEESLLLQTKEPNKIVEILTIIERPEEELKH